MILANTPVSSSLSWFDVVDMWGGGGGGGGTGE